MPAPCPEMMVEYRFGATLYRITVDQPGLIAGAGAQVTLDGHVLDGVDIRLHHVRVAPRARNRTLGT